MAYASNAVLEHVIRETCMLSTAPLNCGKDLKMWLLWAVLNTINSKKSMNCLWLKRTRAKWKSSICLGFKALNVCFLCSFFCLVSFHNYLSFYIQHCNLKTTKRDNSKPLNNNSMKFSLPKPVFVKLDVCSSGVSLIKVLTRFDMHECLLSFCFWISFSLLFLLVVFFQVSFTDGHKKYRTWWAFFLRNELPTMWDLFIYLIYPHMGNKITTKVAVDCNFTTLKKKT